MKIIAAFIAITLFGGIGAGVTFAYNQTAGRVAPVNHAQSILVDEWNKLPQERQDYICSQWSVMSDGEKDMFALTAAAEAEKKYPADDLSWDGVSPTDAATAFVIVLNDGCGVSA